MRGFTLIELMIVIAIIAIIAAIAIPGLLASQRGANERNASASLKTVATAEVDFRQNDRDGNALNDYWVDDIQGLYSIENNPGNPIRLIESPVARADAAPDLSNYPGGSTTAVVGTPTEKAGVVLDADQLCQQRQLNRGVRYRCGRSQSVALRGDGVPR